MKTHRHLWEQFISPENFDLAAKKAVRGKKSKADINKFLANRAEKLDALRKLVASGKFKTSQYRIKKIFEPKERYIYVLPLYPDHIVHHALINILGPIWQKMFIRDSYACIPGRGLRDASLRVMKLMRENEYVLQCDIRKFYPNIRHQRMMEIVARKISDKKILDLLSEIVWSVGGDKNIPIGNLTSQWLGNVYLNELDQFVKQTLHWRQYLRYCDDFCLMGNNQHMLHWAAKELAAFLYDDLGLEFSKCVVRRTCFGMDYIGYRHFRGFILLRRRSARKIRRRIINIAVHNDMSYHSLGQLASARGWLKWACSYNYCKSVIRCVENTGCNPYMTKCIRNYLVRMPTGVAFRQCPPVRNIRRLCHHCAQPGGMV